MRCDEAAEFVSALCDGEAVPRIAAEHIRTCVVCKERLRKYMEMGAELRLMASAAMEDGVSPREWKGRRDRLAILWQKGWETMRVPRLAFAVLIAAVVGLGSMFAVVQVRARSNGSVVLLKIAWPGGKPFDCPLSLVDKKQATCGSVGLVDGKWVGYQIDLIGRKGDGVELGVRSKTSWPGSGHYDSNEVGKEPQRQMYFEPGQTAKLGFADAETFTMTGEWLDHMPVFLGESTQDVQVGPEELRLVAPLMISGKQVLGDFYGGTVDVDKAGEGAEVYLPREEHFIFALSPMRGAVQARVDLNRISFEEDGRPYIVVTGSPVSRAEHVWVVHETALGKGDGKHAVISAGPLTELAPEVVMDGAGAAN